MFRGLFYMYDFFRRLVELGSNLHLKFQVSLLTENGNTKDDLRLPTDESLLSQVSGHFVFPLRIQLGIKVVLPLRIPAVCPLNDFF